jgi:thiosulfate dehydrogenase [quinone] large subunit
VNLKERTYLAYGVLLRLWIGYYLLQQGVNKYVRDFPQRDWFTGQFGNVADLNLFSWYKAFLENVVFAHKEMFGYLVMAGEILVGSCLLLGLFTRFSACVGLFMLVNYFLGPGMARGGAQFAHQQTYIVSLIVLILANPGRTLGLDGLLFRKR